MKKKNTLILLVVLLFFLGCTREEEFSIVLTASKTEIKADGNDAVTFTITDNQGNVLGMEAQLFVNDTPMNGTSFTSEIAGEFYFQAKLNATVSNAEKVVVTPEFVHEKNIVIEDYTGTWCGYCPRVANALREVLAKRNNVVPVAIHDDNDMRFSSVSTLKNEFGIDGFPTALIDRKETWQFPETDAGLTNALQSSAVCGIALQTNVANKKGEVVVEVEFAKGFVADCKLVVFVTEDKLYYDQVNYYPEYGSNPIKNFEHNHVLKLSLTHVLGDDIEANQNGSFSSDFKFNLNKMNDENVAVVAFVVNSNSREVLNVRAVKIGENAGFQYLN